MKPTILTNMLRNAYRDHPRGSTAEIRETLFYSMGVQNGNNYTEALFDYWFNNSVNDFEVLIKSDNEIAVLDATKSHNRRQKSKRAVDKLKGNILSLMDHYLSSGTLIRFATFAEAGKEGGWLTAVSKLGKANEIIGRKLTEKDLQNVALRFQARVA